MSEYAIGNLAVGGMLGLTLSTWLYMIGGRANKIIRRLGAALVLAVTVNLLSVAMGKWHPLMIAILPSLFAGFSMGYGANVGYLKFVRRLLYCLGVCSAGAIMALALGGNAWMILPLHIGVGLWTIFLGLKNPTLAASEEVFVCALLNIGIIIYPFIG